MPVVEEDGEDLVFLSPDESPPKEKDQGASPVLRRSTRKRKSVSAAGPDMSKGSSTKKKKCSPSKPPSPKKGPSEDPGKNMPRIPRSPVQGQPPGPEPEKQKPDPPDFAELLLAMEKRLASKIEATNKAVNEAVTLSKMSSDAIDALEEKVDANEENLREALTRIEKQDERVLARVEDQVKEMVRAQLKEVGFDTQLSAGDLSTIQSRRADNSYAAVAEKNTTSYRDNDTHTSRSSPSQKERREAAFWECRRSLRLWPIMDPTVAGLNRFLEDKLKMDAGTIQDIGPVKIRRSLDKKTKGKKECLVIFDNKQVRDEIKSHGSNLANYRDEAGMHLHLPDFLQKDFQALMSLAYDIKKNNKDLRRNVKFDEESFGLFMDIQTEREGPWRRIRPAAARKALESRPRQNAGPADLDECELSSLLGTGSE